MKRIQRERTKGWRMPEGGVYVGRPSKWGNPFPIQGDSIRWAAVALGHKADAAGRRLASVALYRAWLTDDYPVIDTGPNPHGEFEYHDGSRRTVAQHVQGIAGFALTLKPFVVPRRPDLRPLFELATEGTVTALVCWCPLVDADGQPVPCHADVLIELLVAHERAEAGVFA